MDMKSSPAEFGTYALLNVENRYHSDHSGFIKTEAWIETLYKSLSSRKPQMQFFIK